MSLKILAGTPTGKGLLGVDGGTILEWTLKKRNLVDSAHDRDY